MSNSENRKRLEEIKKGRIPGIPVGCDTSTWLIEQLEKAWKELEEEKNKCPPHSWSRDGERCSKCGTKDWMT